MTASPRSEETIFTAALARPPAERAAFLDAACAGDAALRARLESLLRMPEEAPDFMAASAAEVPYRLELAADDRIGRYKLLQKIGHLADAARAWLEGVRLRIATLPRSRPNEHGGRNSPHDPPGLLC